MATLIAHWKLDQTSGLIANDRSGNGFTGSLVNMSGNQWTPGKWNNRLVFDGIDDEIRVNVPNCQSGSMSFSFWIYINSNSYYTPILKTDDRNYYDSTSGWIINVGTDWRGPTSLAILQFKATGQQVYQGVTSLEDSVPAGKWNHIVAIIDNVSKIAKISINGSPNVSGSFLGEPILSSDPIILGGARWPLNGKLDEIRLFDGVLTDEQISNLYNYNSLTKPTVSSLFSNELITQFQDIF